MFWKSGGISGLNSWNVTIWGRPPSINHLYTTVWRTDLRGRKYKGRAKDKRAVQYQSDAVLQMRVAKPSRWDPSGQVQMIYDLYLTTDIDCDNLMKTLSDAFEEATGVNDSRVLPCVRSKLTGVPLKEARVELTFISLQWPSQALDPSKEFPSPSSLFSSVSPTDR